MISPLCHSGSQKGQKVPQTKSRPQGVSLSVTNVRHTGFSWQIPGRAVLPSSPHGGEEEYNMRNDICMQTRQKRQTQKCATCVLNAQKTRYTPVKRDRKLPAFPEIPISETPQKRDTHLKNEIGMNFGNKFPPPLI